MKKQGIVILLLLAMLALIGGGVFLLREPSEQGQESSAAAREDDVIWAIPEELLSRIWVQTPEAGGYSATKTPEGWVIDSLEGIPLNSSALHTLISSATNLKSVREIPDGAERLSEFGLTEEKASAIVEAGLSENDRERILVGDEVPGTDKKSRYVEKDGRVFVVYETKVGVFLKSDDQFVDREITPSTRASVEKLSLQSVEISGAGYMDGMELPLSVRLAENREVAGAPLALYEMTSPWQIDVDASAAAVWAESFFNLSGAEICTVFPTEEDYVYYGLAEPWAKVTLKAANAAGEITVSEFSLSELSGTWFASVPGRDVIYIVEMDGVDWVERSLQDLVKRQLLTPSLLSLSALTIEETGKEPSVIQLEPDEAANSTRAVLAGTELPDKSFRNFYYTVINQTAEEVLFEGAALPDRTRRIAEIRYTYAGSGSEDVLDYYRESDRMLLVEKNGGELAWRVSESKLEQVLENLEKLAAGEEIEARY